MLYKKEDYTSFPSSAWNLSGASLSVMAKLLFPPPKLKYVCACVLILWSRKALHEAEQLTWSFRGPPGQLAHRGTMPARCRGELCWVCSSFCSWGSDTMEFSSPDEVTQQIRNEHTRQSPYIRAFLKPGKSSYTHTCQSGESHQWRRGNR